MRIHRDFVVIVPIESKTYGTLVIPDEVQEAHHASNRDFIREYNRAGFGKVVSVGPGYYDDEREEYIVADVEVGMRVAYERAAALSADWWEGEPSAVIVRSDAVYFEVVEGDIEVVLGGVRAAGGSNVDKENEE